MIPRINFIIICLMFFITYIVFSQPQHQIKQLDLSHIKTEDPFFYDVALRKEFQSGGPPRITKWKPNRIINYYVKGNNGSYTTMAHLHNLLRNILIKLESLTNLKYQHVTNQSIAHVIISFDKNISTRDDGGIVHENVNDIRGLTLAQIGSDEYLKSGTIQVINSLSSEETYAVLLEECTQQFTGIYNDTEDIAHKKSIFYKFKNLKDLHNTGYTYDDTRVIKRLYSGEFD